MILSIQRQEPFFGKYYDSCFDSFVEEEYEIETFWQPKTTERYASAQKQSKKLKRKLGKLEERKEKDIKTSIQEYTETIKMLKKAQEEIEEKRTKLVQSLEKKARKSETRKEKKHQENENRKKRDEKNVIKSQEGIKEDRKTVIEDNTQTFVETIKEQQPSIDIGQIKQNQEIIKEAHENLIKLPETEGREIEEEPILIEEDHSSQNSTENEEIVLDLELEKKVEQLSRITGKSQEELKMVVIHNTNLSIGQLYDLINQNQLPV